MCFHQKAMLQKCQNGVFLLTYVTKMATFYFTHNCHPIYEQLKFFSQTWNVGLTKTNENHQKATYHEEVIYICEKYDFGLRNMQQIESQKMTPKENLIRSYAQFMFYFTNMKFGYWQTHDRKPSKNYLRIKEILRLFSEYKRSAMLYF